VVALLLKRKPRCYSGLSVRDMPTGQVSMPRVLTVPSGTLPAILLVVVVKGLPGPWWIVSRIFAHNTKSSGLLVFL
jgi:hypothetical protein